MNSTLAGFRSCMSLLRKVVSPEPYLERTTKRFSSKPSMNWLLNSWKVLWVPAHLRNPLLGYQVGGVYDRRLVILGIVKDLLATVQFYLTWWYSSKFPSLARTIKLPIVKSQCGPKLRHLLAQSPILYFLLLLLASSQRLQGAPSRFRTRPKRIQEA